MTSTFSPVLPMPTYHRNNFIRSGVAAILLAMLCAFGVSDSAWGKTRAKVARPPVRRQVVEIDAPSPEVNLSADLDGDRRADRITIQNQSGSYEVEISLTTRPGIGITLEGESGPVLGLAVLDTNSDRASDIVVATASPAHPLNSWVGNGRGGFVRQAASRARMGCPVPTSRRGKGTIPRTVHLTPNSPLDVEHDITTRALLVPLMGQADSGPGELLPRRPDPNVIGTRGPPRHIR